MRYYDTRFPTLAQSLSLYVPKRPRFCGPCCGGVPGAVIYQSRRTLNQAIWGFPGYTDPNTRFAKEENTYSELGSATPSDSTVIGRCTEGWSRALSIDRTGSSDREVIDERTDARGAVNGSYTGTYINHYDQYRNCVEDPPEPACSTTWVDHLTETSAGAIPGTPYSPGGIPGSRARSVTTSYTDDCFDPSGSSNEPSTTVNTDHGDSMSFFIPIAPTTLTNTVRELEEVAPIYFSLGSKTITTRNELVDEVTEADRTALLDADLATLINPSVGRTCVQQVFYRRKIHRWLDHSSDGAYDAALAARIAADEALVASGEASLEAAESDLEDLEALLGIRQSELAAADLAISEAVAAASAKKAEIVALDSAIVGLENRIAHDPDMTDSEKAAAQEDVTAKLIERAELLEEYNAILVEINGYDEPILYDARNILHDQVRDLVERQIPEAEDLVALWEAQIADYEARLAASTANEDYLGVNYFATGAAEAFFNGTAGNLTVARQKAAFRYRVRVDLAGYDTAGGSSVTVRWREQSVLAGVSTWTEKSEVVAVASAARYASTGWHEVAAPSVVGTTITITGPKVEQATLNRSIEAEGGQARKRGIWAYVRDGSARIFRRETFAGGFAGCPSSGESARNYSGVRELSGSSVVFTTAASADLTAALQASRWPARFRYQQIALNSLVTGLPAVIPAEPQSETETRREFSREVICGTSSLPETLVSELDHEFTTAELEAEVNALITGDNWDYQEHPEPSENPFDPWVFSPATAIRWLTPDETFYRRLRLRVSFSISVPGTGTIPNSVVLNFGLRLVKVSMATGAVTVETIPLSSTSSGGSFPPPSPVVIDPAQGELIFVSGLTGGDLDLADRRLTSPVIYPNEEPPSDE